MNTKKVLLSASGVLVLSATTLGISSLFINTAQIVTKFLAAAGMLGLASIGLFFVGAVFPNEQKGNSSNNEQRSA